jgi:ATP-dependent Clp protease ATP-binding subunit ClpA
MADRFDKFTERARRVLTMAQEEAQQLEHNYIGTEHILLALTRQGDSAAAHVLASLGVDAHKVRTAVEFIIGRGDRAVLGEVGLTPRAKKVIELAVDEARRLNHHYVGTEHMLLGLVREGEGIAAGVLESLGVNIHRLRTETTRALLGGASGGEPAGAGHAFQYRVPRAGISASRAPLDDSDLAEARARHVDTPIEDLGLSVRAYGCLKRSGLMTVGQVMAKSEDELLALRNFGMRSYDELRERLVEIGVLRSAETEATSMRGQPIDEALDDARRAPFGSVGQRRVSRRGSSRLLVIALGALAAFAAGFALASEIALRRGYRR